MNLYTLLPRVSGTALEVQLALTLTQPENATPVSVASVLSVARTGRRLDAGNA